MCWRESSATQDATGPARNLTHSLTDHRDHYRRGQSSSAKGDKYRWNNALFVGELKKLLAQSEVLAAAEIAVLTPIVGEINELLE